MRFSYFDTQKRDYVEIVKGPFELKVSGGQEAPADGQLRTPLPSAGSSKQSLTLLDQDIRFIDLGSVRWKRIGASRTGLWWVLGALPFLLIAITQLLFSRKKQRFQNRAEIRASKAFRKVQRGIRALGKNPEEEHSDQLHTLMEDYLFEKLGIGRSQMNAERWSKLLLEKNIEQATVDRLIAVYKSLLGGRFAPGGTDIGARSEELLSALEEQKNNGDEQAPFLSFAHALCVACLANKRPLMRPTNATEPRTFKAPLKAIRNSTKKVKHSAVLQHGQCLFQDRRTGRGRLGL